MACPYLQVNVSRIFRHSSTNTNPIWKLWNAFSSSSKLSQTSGMEYMLITDIQDIKGILAGISTPTGGSGVLFPRNPHQPLDAWFQCSTAFPSGPNHFLKYLGHTYYTTMALESHKNIYVNMTYLYIYIISYLFSCWFNPRFSALPPFFPTFVIRITPRCPLTPFAVLKLIQGLGEKKTWSKAWALKVFPFTTCILFFLLTLQNWGGKLVDNFHGFGT